MSDMDELLLELAFATVYVQPFDCEAYIRSRLGVISGMTTYHKDAGKAVGRKCLYSLSVCDVGYMRKRLWPPALEDIGGRQTGTNPLSTRNTTTKSKV